MRATRGRHARTRPPDESGLPGGWLDGAGLVDTGRAWSAPLGAASITLFPGSWQRLGEIGALTPGLTKGRSVANSARRKTGTLAPK